MILTTENTKNLKQPLLLVQQYFTEIRSLSSDILSSFMTYHRVCNWINTTGVSSGAGTAYPSGAPESPLCLVLFDLLFYMYVLLIFVCPFVLFLLAIFLSVLLRCTDSDYPFAIFHMIIVSLL